MEDNLDKKDFFKIKVALLFGYNGLPFHGLQKNKDVKTIEESLENALFDAELIPKYNFGELKKSGWKRAARTDKGVHAISNVVNCKLAIKRHFIDEFKEESEEIIKATNKESTKNERLSKVTFKNQINWNKIINTLNSNMANIKIFAIRRVTKKFDSKNSARCRFYEYLIPISVFKKPSEKTDCSEEFDNKILEKINIITKKFIGSKNFHNYSRKMKAKDPKSWRIIIEFEARILKIQDLMTEEKISEYKTESLKDMKYLVFKIIGQSFIYHQIRKMIGSLIQYFQKDLPEIFFENAFSNDIVKIWLAPAEGLFLNRVNFDAYNAKKDIPEILDFTEEEEKTIENFRKEVIYPIIIESELKNNIYSEWLKTNCDPRNNEPEESESDNADEEG